MNCQETICATKKKAGLVGKMWWEMPFYFPSYSSMLKIFKSFKQGQNMGVTGV